ncbi:MAG: hypothetical protein B7Y30_10335, partial [Campylobacterales bacterium 16-40-21]
MTPKDLEQSYQQKKSLFHAYITKVKQNAPWDIFTIVNPTIIKNPYTSSFPKRFFEHKASLQKKTLLFLLNTIKFYAKNFYLFSTYSIAFIVYKMYYKKERKYNIKTIIDTFGLIDKTNEGGTFNENYLTGIYEIFEQYNEDYTILLRPYKIGKNPFKLILF